MFKLKSFIVLIIIFLATLSYASNDATFVSIEAPNSVNKNVTFSVTVRMKNSGDRVWETGFHKLGATNPRDNSIWTQSRIDLMNDVQPGEIATFKFQSIAPNTPGEVSFSWEMLEELVEWFGEVAEKKISVVENVHLPPPSMAADEKDLLSATIFNTGAYLFSSPANPNYDIHKSSWTNQSGYNILIKKVYIWTGVDRGGICDTSVVVYRDRDGSVIHAITWDHYDEPTAPNHGVWMDYGDDYIFLRDGESLKLNYVANSPQLEGYRAHHQVRIMFKYER